MLHNNGRKLATQEVKFSKHVSYKHKKQDYKLKHSSICKEVISRAELVLASQLLSIFICMLYGHVKKLWGGDWEGK